MKPVENQGAMTGPSFFDRLVTAIAPRWGFERHKARLMLNATGYGGYTGGRRDRRALRNYKPPEANADADILRDLPDLRARARDLARNNPIATGAIATTVTNVIGDGLQLQASIDGALLGMTDQQADAWEQASEREWALFSASADFNGVQPFEELQALALRALLESGDVFVVRRYRKDKGDVYGTKLQILEADRVSNPDRAADSDTIAGGVEVDKDGRPVAYHVSEKHPGAVVGLAKMKWTRVAARTPAGVQVVLHLYDRLRPEQTRGVPYLAPVIEHLAQLGKYTEAEVAGAVMNAMIVAFTKTNADQTLAPILGERGSAAANGDNLEANEVEMGSAMQIHLRPNEEVQFPAPGRPNSQFDPFVQAFLRQVGVALELPFELLIKHFTASYSASRAALEMAWQYFRRRRTFVARRLCQVVYEWVMEEAIVMRRLEAPGYLDDPLVAAAYCGAEWIGPSRASLNPKMEAEADEIDMRAGVKTGEQVCLERTGGEIEKKIAQLGKERAMRDQAGLIPAPAPAAQPGKPSPSDDDARGDAEDETQQPKREQA